MSGFTCNDCGSSGSLHWMQTHPCADNARIRETGGQCEDYPCCGHTDGDGCATLESHTSAYYLANPMAMHEPGSPEWYDAMDDSYDGEDDDLCSICGETYGERGCTHDFDSDPSNLIGA